MTPPQLGLIALIASVLALALNFWPNQSSIAFEKRSKGKARDSEPSTDSE